MDKSFPNPIKEYYIAYFDILGYRKFFETQPEKIPELLNTIHNAIENTIQGIETANKSPLMSIIGKMTLFKRIFSDNVLLCMEVLEESIEQGRILAFMQIVADIQRSFVIEHGLFVRGCILKGLLSVNDEYVFGQGLIEAVEMEGEALYPRIVIDNRLIALLQVNNQFLTQEDIDKASKIEQSKHVGEAVTSEEQTLYYQVFTKVQFLGIIRKVMPQLTFQWPDNYWVLCYLYWIDNVGLFGKEQLKTYLQMLKESSPYDFKLIGQPSKNFDTILLQHKNLIETQLEKYGNNADIKTADKEAAEFREKTLRKYIWVMTFHNLICKAYRKTEFMILTRSNLEPRFMKTTLEVLKD